MNRLLNAKLKSQILRFPNTINKYAIFEGTKNRVCSERDQYQTVYKIIRTAVYYFLAIKIMKISSIVNQRSSFVGTKQHGSSNEIK